MLRSESNCLVGKNLKAANNLRAVPSILNQLHRHIPSRWPPSHRTKSRPYPDHTSKTWEYSLQPCILPLINLLNRWTVASLVQPTHLSVSVDLEDVRRSFEKRSDTGRFSFEGFPNQRIGYRICHHASLLLRSLERSESRRLSLGEYSLHKSVFEQLGLILSSKQSQAKSYIRRDSCGVQAHTQPTINLIRSNRNFFPGLRFQFD